MAALFKVTHYLLSLHIMNVRIQGPSDEEHWVNPPEYDRFFPRPEPPEGNAERRDDAREVLRPFLDKAFRRPVDEPTLERLVDLAESTYATPGSTFEQGIQQAMTAALSSKRFLFRIEQPTSDQAERRYPSLDEHSLASRLFLCDPYASSRQASFLPIIVFSHWDMRP